MEESHSREANRFWDSQEIPRILWNPMDHYRVYKCPPSIPILSQINPLHVPQLTSWRSILILHYHLSLGLPSSLFPSGFSTTIRRHFSYPPTRTTCPAHLINRSTPLKYVILILQPARKILPAQHNSEDRLRFLIKYVFNCEHSEV